MSDGITFITAGGTIDKDYASSAGTYNFEISDPAIRRILDTVRPNLKYLILEVLKKDSLDMNDHDRTAVLKACKNTVSRRIVITHGTDTMVKTAKVLSILEDKVIVLAGSSRPERFRNSDAHFNVGLAVGAVQSLPCGVYIAMNARVYPWRECQKNRETGVFEKTSALA